MKPAVFLTLVLLLKVLLPDKCASTDSCFRQELGSIRLTGPSQIRNEGAVQICLNLKQSGQYLWYYITNSGWSETAVQVACRELGLPFTNANVTRTHIWLNEAAATVTTPVRCTAATDQLITCLLETDLDQGQQRTVGGIICNCTEGAVRLVDGYTHTEGRVEVCVNGRWGTVCGRGWTEQQAGLVCSRLGYSTTGTALRQFGEGTGPIHTLDCQDDPNCVPTLSTQPGCTHADDLGVVCSAFDEFCTPAASTDQTVIIVLSILMVLLASVLLATVAGWFLLLAYYQQRMRKLQATCTAYQASPTNPVNASESFTTPNPTGEKEMTFHDTINKSLAQSVVSSGDNDPTENQVYKAVRCVINQSYDIARRGEHSVDDQDYETVKN